MSDRLEYRFATATDIEDAARLVAHSFPGPPRTPAYIHEQLTDPVYGGGVDTLVLGFDGPRVVAAVQIHPLEQWVAGTPLAVTGIGTVTVSPTYRKRRVAAAVLQAAHRLARERGDVACALYPFRASFYQNLGYGHAGEAYQYLVPPSSFPESSERDRVEAMDSGASREEVRVFYNAWIHSQTGQLTRNERLFAKIMSVTDRGVFAYRGARGAIEGYAIANYRVDLPRRDRYLEVDELVWSTVDARRGLYGWLATLGDQWEQILVRSLPSARTGDWLREPRLPAGAAPTWALWSGAATVMMGPMFRLLNAEEAWSRRRIHETPGQAFTLDIADTIQENAGTWRLALEGNTASLKHHTAVGANNSGATISMNISTLSRLYIGSMSATNAHAAGLLACDRPERLHALDAALALPEPWTFDRF